MTALDALERTQAEHHRTAMAALAAAQAALATPTRRYRPLGDCALQPRARIRIVRPATEHEVELARVVLNYRGGL
jgi:hypothetical protein